MPTKNPRLNVVLEPSLYKTLSKLADVEGVSLSLAARDLIKEALEIYGRKMVSSLFLEISEKVRNL